MVGVLVVTVAAAVAMLPHQPRGFAEPGEGAGESRPGTRVLGDGLIVPGHRIGPLRLTMTIDQITAAIGARPRRDEFAPEGITLYEWRAEGIWVSQVTATRAIRVISVFGTSDGYRTDRGVSLLGARSQIERAYGTAYKAYDYPEDRMTLIRYPDLGLQFGLVNQPSNRPIHGRIFQIGVFKPGDLPPLRRPGR